MHPKMWCSECSTEGRSLWHSELRGEHEGSVLRHVLPPQSAQVYRCLRGHGIFGRKGGSLWPEQKV